MSYVTPLGDCLPSKSKSGFSFESELMGSGSSTLSKERGKWGQAEYGGEQKVVSALFPQSVYLCIEET